MRRYSLLFTILLLSSTTSFAQLKDFSYKFYGQIRTDLFYNSRANEETVDGLFYMYPKDKVYDADGKDLNATANGSFYALYTRMGLDVQGPKTSAKVELDFRGSGTTFSVVRLRHAYLNLDWGTSALLLGQTWHPLYGDVAPQILNLNMGAPFQPFSRAPQIRYRYKTGDIQITGAALWQSQYLSQGPEGKSQKYIKNSCVPEIYAGIDYKHKGLLIGAGIEMVSMLGGYGIKSIDPRTGEQEYSPNRNSSSWINIVYGKTWKPAIFFGYMKNLGTSDAVTNMYGTGTNVDQLLSGTAELTYNVPHWKLGVEYNLTSAWYGSLNHSNGKVVDTHSVSNNRLVATALFMF